MQAIVRSAAEPIEAGESTKAQIRRSWETLGKPAYWRVRKAWFGLAGEWISEAVEDFRERDRQRRQEAKEEAAEMAERLERLRQALAVSDAEFHRPEIDALRFALHRLRR